MKRHIVIALLCAAWPSSPAVAHTGDAADARGPLASEGPRAGEARIEASALVTGTVRQLRRLLWETPSWPGLFSDVRSIQAHPGCPVSIDFARFAHAHDFFIIRTARGVTLRLAADDHGQAQLDYLLLPFDATRSRLVVRFFMTTPPGMTDAQATAILRGKASNDLADFVAFAR